MASTDAKPFPRKNVAFRAYFDLRLNTGALNSGAAGLDSEVSKDGGAMADCTNEATEIATSSGHYYLDLTSTEMNADSVVVQVKSSTSNAVTRTLIIYPVEATDVGVDVISWNGTAIPGTDTAGYPKVTIKSGTGTGELSLSSGQVILQSGTGTGQLDFTSGVVKANVTQFGGTNATSSGGRPEVNMTHIAGTAWASTTLFTLASHDPGATIGTSTLTQTQVTGGAYALNSSSFSFASALDFTTTQKTSIGTAVAASAVASVTAAVTVGTNNDKTGYRLSATGVDDIWDEAQSGHSTAGTFGKYLDAAISGVSTGGVSAADIADAVWDEAGSGHVTSGTFGARLDALISSRMATFTLPTNFASFAITAAGKVTIGTNDDKTGYSLSVTPPTAAAIADAVWDEAQSGHTTAGTFGKYLDSEVSGAGGGSAPTASQIADAVWDEALAGHATAGTAGAALSAAGSAGDPWSTLLPGSYTAGTAGFIIGNRIPNKTDLITADNVNVSSPLSIDGGTITAKRGDTWTITLSDIGDLTGWTELLFVAKPTGGVNDYAALALVSKTAGLEILNGTPAATAAQGAITINTEATGDITVTIAAAATAVLPIVTAGAWAVKLIVGATAQTLTEGTFVVTESTIDATA